MGQNESTDVGAPQQQVAPVWTAGEANDEGDEENEEWRRERARDIERLRFDLAAVQRRQAAEERRRRQNGACNKVLRSQAISEYERQEVHEPGKSSDERERERERQAKEAQQKVESFLRLHGFKEMDQKRRKMLAMSYPLHAAVEEHDAEMVALLIQARADPDQQNASGRTPRDLANKLSMGGKLHVSCVLSALSTPMSTYR
eukprot:gnl/TRDRNA2_/TRDRNA2_31740_c0_seq1.p1 gnl/TRDRNA2_/TRDRNA2_31740_c0~~gnl/TRDRNA2_/TRDRNA2_31740_c0_seq1.p1  ORF type:complete len:202 (-),score=42.39 gnl/TRDRNA2_/TRDRNA2_31740_c0_seq1:41-646(-)